MIVKDEEKVLRMTAAITYPVNAKIALDTGSTDNTISMLTDTGWMLYNDGPITSFASTRNNLLLTASCGYDWLLMLDADEAMFPQDVIKLREICEAIDKPLITLPRINLVHKGELQTCSYPDKQPRCVRLNSGVYFENRVHEVAMLEGKPAPEFFADFTPIYHYGWCKPPRESWARDFNYERLKRGESMLPIEKIPCENETWDWFIEHTSKRHPMEPFRGDHPLRGLI